MLKIVTMTTSERKEETRRIFERIKPYLEEGLSWNKSFQKAGYFKKNYSWTNWAWSRDVVAYAKERGYNNV